MRLYLLPLCIRNDPPAFASVLDSLNRKLDLRQEIRALRVDFLTYIQMHNDIMCWQKKLLCLQDKTLTVLVKELGR